MLSKIQTGDYVNQNRKRQRARTCGRTTQVAVRPLDNPDLTIVSDVGNYCRVTQSQDLASLLRALADPARLRVVELLSEAPRRAGELADDLGLSAPTMSKHLRALLDAGVVADERRSEDARVRVFRLRGESVVAVRAWLDQIQAHWDEQLTSFKAHVERRGRR